MKKEEVEDLFISIQYIIYPFKCPFCGENTWATKAIALDPELQGNCGWCLSCGKDP